MIKNRMERRGQGGFTLIELLVVVAILAILTGVAVVGIGAMRENAKKSACKADFDTIRTAALAYQVSNDATTDIAGLTNAKLLKLKATGFTVTWPAADDPVPVYNDTTGSYGNLGGQCVA